MWLATSDHMNTKQPRTCHAGGVSYAAAMSGCLFLRRPVSGLSHGTVVAPLRRRQVTLALCPAIARGSDGRSMFWGKESAGKTTRHNAKNGRGDTDSSNPLSVWPCFCARKSKRGRSRLCRRNGGECTEQKRDTFGPSISWWWWVQSITWQIHAVCSGSALMGTNAQDRVRLTVSLHSTSTTNSNLFTFVFQFRQLEGSDQRSSSTVGWNGSVHEAVMKSPVVSLTYIYIYIYILFFSYCNDRARMTWVQLTIPSHPPPIETPGLV